MLTVKENVLDRIEQSSEILFKNKFNFLNLILPIFLYKLFFGIFIWNFISFVLLGNLDLETTDIFSSVYYIIIFFFVIVGFILYITFFIGLLISTIKTIKDIFEGKNIDIKNNIKYGFDNLINSFNTYRYIFAYIVLIPFGFIALGGFLFLFGTYTNFGELVTYGLYSLFGGLLLLLAFMIYRGVKTNFSLVSAVDKNSYTDINFRNSVIITTNNWWRIVGNFLLVSLIIGIISSIIGMILLVFKTTIFDVIDFTKIISSYSNSSLNEDMVETITNHIKIHMNTFYINNFFVSIIDLFIDIIKYIFVLIFGYIFYKRLNFELNGDKIKEEIKL